MTDNDLLLSTDIVTLGNFCQMMVKPLPMLDSVTGYTMRGVGGGLTGGPGLGVEMSCCARYVS